VGGRVTLDEMFTTDIYCVWRDEEALCRRLNGYYKDVGGMVFIPIEVVETGRREFVRVDLLELVNGMEVLAWAAKT
jgi:hypothetical protein